MEIKVNRESFVPPMKSVSLELNPREAVRLWVILGGASLGSSYTMYDQLDSAMRSGGYTQSDYLQARGDYGV